ncbi:MAG: arylesterase [Sulfuricella denitrificans]|nr:arylesterase [Sulfuricella denitrificans]
MRPFFSSSFIRLVAILLATALLGACSKAKVDALPSGSVVLALGDSLTAGKGVTPEEAWPSLLAKRTGWVMINGGISGDTSDDAMQRLPDLLDEHKPVMVLVMLGGNDMLRHIPEAKTIANLENILDQISKHGAKAVLLATPRPSAAGAIFQNLSAADFYPGVAERHKLPLIKNAMAEVLSDPKMKGDPLHPNAAGHALFAEKIREELNQIGYIR